jgi:hypothetical protein
MNEPLSIDLNIDRMRAEIYLEITEALRPFYRRLEQLDSVESFLKAKQPGYASPQKRGWLTRQKVRRRAKIVRTERPQKELPSGPTAGIYATVPQGVAIVDAVTKEPGLDPKGVAERLVAGGYPFKGTTPIDAVYVAMRHQVVAGKIRQVTPSAEERDQGKRITYYPIPKRLKIEAFKN